MVKTEFGPGRYFLGDPCYILNDGVYHDVWGGTHGYKEGAFDILTESGSHKFAVSSTTYGDGGYYDQDGNKYGVDSGTIALVPEALWDSNKEALWDSEKFDGAKANGRIIEASTGISVMFSNGTFDVTIDGDKSITIKGILRPFP